MRMRLLAKEVNAPALVGSKKHHNADPTAKLALSNVVRGTWPSYWAGGLLRTENDLMPMMGSSLAVLRAGFERDRAIDHFDDKAMPLIRYHSIHSGGLV